MKTLFPLLALTLFFLHQHMIAEESSRSSLTRTVSLSGTIGELEALGMAVNYQINDSYWLGGRGLPGSARGIGIRGAYYFDPTGNENFFYFNALSCSVMYLFQDNIHNDDNLIQGLGGAGMDVMIGHDNIVGKGLGFVWGVGISASAHQGTPPLLLPAFKWGMHIDL